MNATRALTVSAAALTLADNPDGPVPCEVGSSDDQAVAVAIGSLLRELGEDVLERMALAGGLPEDTPALLAWFANPAVVSIHPRRLTRLLLTVAGQLGRLIEADQGALASLVVAQAFEQAYQVMPDAA